MNTWEESIKVNVYENVRFGELAKIGYNLFWSKKYKIWIFWTLFPLTKLTRNHELQFLLFDRTRSLSLFAWSTRGGTICSNRGPAPRTWGGYAQKGLEPVVPTEAPHQGPGRRWPLRKFDKGIGDRWDCVKIGPPSLLVRARTSRGGGFRFRAWGPIFDLEALKFSIFQNFKFLTLCVGATQSVSFSC